MAFWKKHKRAPTFREFGNRTPSLRTLVAQGRVLRVDGKYIPVTSGGSK